MDADHAQLLRRLALNDEVAVESLVRQSISPTGGVLDARTSALVRLGSLVGLQSSPATSGWSVESALAAGATDEEIVGVLVAVASLVGVARLSSAASEVAVALGYDLDVSDDRG